MGTTLTGTTPQDTYDSLIKVTDNGPLSGTAKYLSDGLGNDSALALSNARVGVGTNAPSMPLTVQRSGTGDMQDWKNGTVTSFLYQDTSKAEFGTLSNHPFVFLTNATECMRITTAGNVGIGTSSPAGNLHIASASDTGIRIQAGTSSLSYIDLADSASGAPAGSIAYNHIVDAIVFGVGGSNTERFRMTANGLCFNGDTAAANALDDYEEGTWTMGVSFGGASVGVTTNLNTGAYTKVGNKVTVTGFLQLSSKGSSTGAAKITGLPFTLPANLNRLSAPSLWFNNITFANQFQGYCDQNSTNIDLYEITEAGVATALTNADFANNSEIMLSATYFV